MERLIATTWVALLCAVSLENAHATAAMIEKATESAPSALVSSLEHETSIPIHDNRFVVDKNIQSLQVIINTDDVQSIKILGPLGIEIQPLQNSDTVNWQQIDKLYAITLKKPAIGQWEVKGKMLATPKIIVDSTLKMVTPDFPNNMFRGETLTISAYLTDKGKRITNKELLAQTQFFATLHNVATLEKYKIFLTDDDARGQGIFRFDYPLQTLPGVYRMTIQAISLLFQREQEQQFYLYDYPATFTSKIISDTDELLVQVELQSPLLDEQTCRFNALFMGREGELSTSLLNKYAEHKWQLFMPVSDATHKMTLLLNGYTIDKRLINITFPDVDVFTMYQKNMSDMRTYWNERWKAFWQQNLQNQLGYLFPFSTEKIRERLLFDVNQELPANTIPLREYPTYQETLLKEWEPGIFGARPQTLVEQLSTPEKGHSERTQQGSAKVASPVTAKTKPLPPPSPWRKWVITGLVVFGLIAVALLMGLLWMFKKKELRSIWSSMVFVFGQLRKIRLKPGQDKAPEEATQGEPVDAVAALLDEAAAAIPAPAVEPKATVEPEAAVEPEVAVTPEPTVEPEPAAQAEAAPTAETASAQDEPAPEPHEVGSTKPEQQQPSA